MFMENKKRFNISDYEEVKDRIPKFFEKYPDGRIQTELVRIQEDMSRVAFVAKLYANKTDQLDGLALATGWAYEIEGEGYINETSHVENCETSAIGRALANIGLHGTKRPSKEEMMKTKRMQKENEVEVSADIEEDLF